MSQTPASSDNLPSEGWTSALVAGLDWKRIVELIRALAAIGGFKLGKTSISPDGAAEFIMLRNPHRSIVRLARWNQWMASAECLAQFAAQLAQGDVRSGVYIAPAGFTQAALNLARQRGIETVDADVIARRLGELPAHDQKYYYDMATAGDCNQPTCPVCLQPLSLQREVPVTAPDFRHMADYQCTMSGIVADNVLARRVEIAEHCEIQFLHEVRALELVVRGITTGTFLCEQSVLLHPGAILYGSVAARAVDVRPGAQLIGETRILDGKPDSFREAAATQVWRCRNETGNPMCASVRFEPH